MSTVNSIVAAVLFWVFFLLFVNYLSVCIYDRLGASVTANTTGQTPANNAHPTPSAPENKTVWTERAGDSNHGRKLFGQCALCHSPVKEGPNRLGPPLWRVFGRQAASIESFRYSRAMREFGLKGGKWDSESLDAFLTAPQHFVRGTAMTFAGIKNNQDRADLIRYLQSLTEDSQSPANEGGDVRAPATK